MMTRLRDHPDAEALMRAQIVAFLEEYCRGMALCDVREWFAEAGRTDAPCVES